MWERSYFESNVSVLLNCVGPGRSASPHNMNGQQHGQWQHRWTCQTGTFGASFICEHGPMDLAKALPTVELWPWTLTGMCVCMQRPYLHLHHACAPFILHPRCRFGTFPDPYATNFAINIYDGGKVTSIVCDSGAHGTHVAGAASALYMALAYLTFEP